MRDPMALTRIINSWHNSWIYFLGQGIKRGCSCLCSKHIRLSYLLSFLKLHFKEFLQNKI
ncbi:mCG147985 [Mus musculus]|nr:mCG147985 [Mus musculus]